MLRLRVPAELPLVHRPVRAEWAGHLAGLVLSGVVTLEAGLGGRGVVAHAAGEAALAAPLRGGLPPRVVVQVVHDLDVLPGVLRTNV